MSATCRILVFDMPEQPLEEVARQFSRYAAADVLAKIGALQLIPENARRATRLELAACAAAARDAADGKRAASPSALRSILDGPILSDPQLIMMEDPVGGWFVESLTFLGGAYLMFPGIAINAAFILRHLGQAIALHRKPYSNAQFASAAVRLFHAVLTLSNEVVRRAGLERGVLPIEVAGEHRIVVPRGERLAQLSTALRFSQQDLDRLLCSCGHNVAVLEPLVAEAGQLRLEDCDPHAFPLQATPIVHVGDEYIVASPALLAPALRHQVICMAKQHSVLDELVERITGAAWLTASKCLRHMKILPVGVPYPASLLGIGMADGLFSFDTDKALYACVITDDCTDYEEHVVFGHQSRKDLWPALRTRFREVADSLFLSSNSPNELLCLVLANGVGRSLGLSLAAHDKALPYELLGMSLPDLWVIAHLEGGKQLCLSRFAKALRRLRSKSQVIAFGALNEYGCYRQNKYSFYLSDEAPPNVISLDSGWEGLLSREALDRGRPSRSLILRPPAHHRCRGSARYTKRAHLCRGTNARGPGRHSC